MTDKEAWKVYRTPGEIPLKCLMTEGAVTLRPVTYEDTENILRWRNDPAVRERFVYRETLTKQVHEAWLREKVATGKVLQFVICEAQSGLRPVGSVFLRDIDREKRTAEYGIFIGESDARGRGYASLTARRMVAYAFSELSLKTVGLRVYTDNAPAIASYERAGFRTVRTLKNVTASDGATGDMFWMEAYAEDSL